MGRSSHVFGLRMRVACFTLDCLVTGPGLPTWATQLLATREQTKLSPCLVFCLLCSAPMHSHACLEFAVLRLSARGCCHWRILSLGPRFVPNEPKWSLHSFSTVRTERSK